MLHRRTVRDRRGAAAVMLVVLLVLLNLAMLSLVLGGARDHELTVNRLETVRAFYACEAGMNMAVRELMVNADEDGDGTIGSVSDDGNAGNNPTVGTAASLVVTMTDGGGQTLVESTGSSGAATRVASASLEE